MKLIEEKKLEETKYILRLFFFFLETLIFHLNKVEHHLRSIQNVVANIY